MTDGKIDAGRVIVGSALKNEPTIVRTPRRVEVKNYLNVALEGDIETLVVTLIMTWSAWSGSLRQAVTRLRRKTGDNQPGFGIVYIHQEYGKMR